MQKFTALTSVPAPLPIMNIDTDMIIPKQFLRTIKRTGLSSGLFYEMRFDENGAPKPEFVLNRAPYTKSTILVAGDNFGCGSSREHAPWALLDFGIRAIIAPSYSDIFFNNCFKNGILPIALPQSQVDQLMKDAEDKKEITINLPEQKITSSIPAPSTGEGQGGGEESWGGEYHFSIDPFRKHCLIGGLDDIGLTLEKESLITSYEDQRAQTRPWI